VTQDQRVGTGSIALQIDGNNNTVTLHAGATRLKLSRRHLVPKVPPRSDRDLLLTELRVIDLVGRAGNLAAWDAWLNAPPPIAGRCLVARADTGKTRLAIELCERAEQAGWIAGFVRHDELKRFYAQNSLEDWRWGQKTRSPSRRSRPR
jgi:hypothetical protein